MSIRIYIITGLCFAQVFCFCAYAKYETDVWDYTYFLTGKIATLYGLSIISDWIKYLPYSFIIKKRITVCIKYLALLFIVRIIWEIISIIKSYDFMVQSTQIDIYLLLLTSLTVFLIIALGKSYILKGRQK